MIYAFQPQAAGMSVPCTSDFGAYLHLSKNQHFVLDLSGATLLEVIEEFISIKEKVSPKFRRNLSCLVRNIRLVEEQYGCTLAPVQITDVFWYHFTSHLQQKGIAISSIKTLCSQLRSILSWGSRHRAVISPSFDYIQLPQYSHEQIALTPDDVSRIYHFDLSTIKRRPQYIKHMERVKDMFVLSCSLGQRFSDMVRVDSFCFDRNTFTILQQKTGTKAKVDINKFAVDAKTVYKILEKYNYRSPLTTDISCYNRYLKELMKYVGLTEEIKRETKINGLIHTEYIPKYKLIGSHTARRTFVTINVLRGIPLHEIMRASGHTSYSSFQRYLCYYDN